MEVTITKEDLKKIDKFLESGILTNEMNKSGLSFGAMALILTAISNECDRILEEMNEEEKNVC